MRVAAILSSIVVLAAIGGTTTVYAQGSQSAIVIPEFYENFDARFTALFPSPPEETEITYTAADGGRFPARQFSVVNGPNKYSVTVADFSSGGGPAVDLDAVVHAQNEMIGQGELIFQSNHAYEPGVESRQFLASPESGDQLHGAIYMWDHHLFVIEARGTRGEPTLLHFAQSITLFEEGGDELNFGGPPGPP
jgi:hypothetical protein